MGFTVRADGSITTESMEEAMKLAEAYAARAAAQRVAPPVTPPATADGEEGREVRVAPKASDGTPFRVAQWDAFLASLNESGRGTLRLIQANPKGITTRELGAQLGLEGPRAFPGVVTGVVKNIGNSGLRAADILIKIKSGYGTSAVTTYKPGKMLLSAPEVPLSEAK